jgi:Na+-transporting methylmalonyl-CoA/oxaloacetate decarboxylase gamma subunit
MFGKVLKDSGRVFKEKLGVLIGLGIISMVLTFLINDLSEFITLWSGLSILKLLGLGFVIYFISILTYATIGISTVCITSNVLLDENKPVMNIIKENVIQLTMSLVFLGIIVMMGVYSITMAVGYMIIDAGMLGIPIMILLYLLVGYILLNYVFYIQSYILCGYSSGDALSHSNKLIKGNKLVTFGLCVVPQLVLLLKYVLPVDVALVISLIYSVLSGVVFTVIITTLFIKLDGHKIQFNDGNETVDENISEESLILEE